MECRSVTRQSATKRRRKLPLREVTHGCWIEGYAAIVFEELPSQLWVFSGGRKSLDCNRTMEHGIEVEDCNHREPTGKKRRYLAEKRGSLGVADFIRLPALS